MVQPAPAELTDLINATEPTACDRAWSRFLERHSGLLMQAARSFGPSYDHAMDRYQYTGFSVLSSSPGWPAVILRRGG